MSINTKSMFDAIKQSLSSEKKGGGNGLFKEILKFQAGNTYLVRLVPYKSAPKDTIFHYYNHGWNSIATGQYVTAVCPTTFGETCPIDAYYLKTYRKGTESEKEASRVLSRKENWMVNVYVISDPTNPENEGKVKILRYGAELDKIITSALEGDDVKEVGVERAFDVLNGCTLRIKCENRTEKGRSKMVTYASSRFLSASVLELEEEDLEKIYDNTHDLRTVNKRSTAAEMQRLLDEHFFGLTTGSAPEEEESEDVYTPPPTPKQPAKAVVSSILDNEDVPVAVKPAKQTKAVVNETDESTDEALKKLLADL